MKIFKILALMILASLLLAIPVSARGLADGRGCDTTRSYGPGGCAIRTGERLLLNVPHQVFPAGEPFYVVSGWVFPAREGDIPEYGQFDIVLEVDGQPITENYIERGADQGVVLWVWIFNFPEGMSGTHTFTLRYVSSCQYAVDLGLLYDLVIVEGPCANRSEQVEWVDYTLTSSVDFQ